MAAGDAALAFLDIRPVNPGHTLVVPRTHAPLVGQLSEREWLSSCALAQRVQAAIRASDDVRCDAINLYVADGEVAGQEVAHVHIHVIPRWKGDGFGLRLPPDYLRFAERSELDRLAASISAAV